MPKPAPRSRPKKIAARMRALRPTRHVSEPEMEKTAFSRSVVRLYRDLLLAKRRTLVDDVEQLEGEAFRKNRQDAAGDLSSMPIHMADLGTDNFEQDVTLGLIETEEEEVREIDAALDRVKKGTYGRCEKCRKMILRSRLKALPYARLCIECKKREERD